LYNKIIKKSSYILEKKFNLFILISMIIKGKPIVQVKEKTLKAKIKELKSTPCLGIILIGKNPASLIYVKLKEKKAKDLGIKIKKLEFSSKDSQKKIIEAIEKLKKNV